MWRIFQFLGRFGNVLLFLFLEAVALLIVVTVNKPQREISQGWMLNMSGRISSVQASWGGYFNLSRENAGLMDQNARLMAELENTRDSLRTVRFREPTAFDYQVLPDSLTQDSAYMANLQIPLDLPDSLFPATGYHFMPARTVNSTIHLNYNYLTLDKGSRHGVEPGMGIISPTGVAGLVTKVSKDYALALSVLNIKFNLSSRLLGGNNNIGNLTWEGGKAEYAALQYIPRTSPIAIGDTVVTSGFSTTFPPDYMVGTVDYFDDVTEDGFFNVRVKLATNFRALDALFVVMHKRSPEMDSLKIEGGAM